MREIKFRVFDTKNRKWIDEDNFFITNNELWLYQADFDNSGSVDTDIYKIMQFTSLFDKKGKEIYEGDIVRATHKAGDSEIRVIFPKDFRFFAYVDLGNCELEVIGNIHEHQHLLGGVDK